MKNIKENYLRQCICLSANDMYNIASNAFGATGYEYYLDEYDGIKFLRADEYVDEQTVKKALADYFGICRVVSYHIHIGQDDIDPDSDFFWIEYEA